MAELLHCKRFDWQISVYGCEEYNKVHDRDWAKYCKNCENSEASTRKFLKPGEARDLLDEPLLADEELVEDEELADAPCPDGPDDEVTPLEAFKDILDKPTLDGPEEEELPNGCESDRVVEERRDIAASGVNGGKADNVRPIRRDEGEARLVSEGVPDSGHINPLPSCFKHYQFFIVNQH
jgi:hypothetical protein